MFNNGKFKNVVADSDADSQSPVDRTVQPGDTLNTTIVLKPQRGQTKNWIALEDTLQRSTEPDEITGAIAASAIRSLSLVLPTSVPVKQSDIHATSHTSEQVAASKVRATDDRNVFAIYVSYYVKVKLTLSSMGGELSLKLPFVLVHVNESMSQSRLEHITLQEVPTVKEKTIEEEKDIQQINDVTNFNDMKLQIAKSQNCLTDNNNGKRRLQRSETLAKDELEEQQDNIYEAENIVTAVDEDEDDDTAAIGVEHIHVVQIHHNTNTIDTEEPNEKNNAAASDNHHNNENENENNENNANSSTDHPV